MTDEIEPGDPLGDEENELRQPVPLMPGIGARRRGNPDSIAAGSAAGLVS